MRIKPLVGEFGKASRIPLPAGFSHKGFLFMRLKDEGDETLALFVCSVGMLRSPTAAQWASENLGWNTRSAGIDEYALIPINERLLNWADRIFCMDKKHSNAIPLEFRKKVKVMHIPDNFNRNDKVLIDLISFYFKNTLKEVKK